MNAALPAILQQPSPAPATRGRNGMPSQGEPDDFGRMLKAGNDAKNGASATALDESDTVSAEPSSDLGLLADELFATDGQAASTDITKPGESEGEEDDKPEAAEALLPFLTIAGSHDRASARQGDAESTQGTMANDAPPPVAKATARPVEEIRDGRKPQPVAVLEKPDSAKSGRRPEAAFGKTLMANLNDLATQPADRPDIRVETSDRDGRVSESPGDARGTRRDRGTLMADAVSRARESRDVGDRRADLRPAADQKAQPAPLAQGPLATGAPVVEALALNPPPAATIHRVAAANAHVGQAAPSVQTLKIQLQPVELGVVTANLRIAGEQLSVEIEVESVEAYNRLSGETDAIARALRSHGIAVEEVVIQAPQIHAVAPARDSGGGFADTSANSGRHFSAGAESGQPGGSGHPNRGGGQDNGYEIDRPSPVEQRTSGAKPRGGVYI
ncbi:flagellar hook-length control protein FliK [Mesorhizobium sp. 1B3]|uniref:flagellar hook-length control protein FliK n=1 Tax=Mesorhizobium sp. 1B3 TaxID=3243599 RepID=UPI003D980439